MRIFLLVLVVAVIMGCAIYLALAWDTYLITETWKATDRAARATMTNAAGELRVQLTAIAATDGP